MNQTFFVTVDVPTGYEATGEYRVPAIGELYLSTLLEGGVGTWDASSLPCNACHFILRRAWTPPAWLPIDRWLYYNGSEWKISTRQPRLRTENPVTYQVAAGIPAVNVTLMASLMGYEWVPPPAHCTARMYQI